MKLLSKTEPCIHLPLPEISPLDFKVHLLSLKIITISERSAAVVTNGMVTCVTQGLSCALAVQSLVLPHSLQGAPW